MRYHREDFAHVPNGKEMYDDWISDLIKTAECGNTVSLHELHSGIATGEFDADQYNQIHLIYLINHAEIHNKDKWNNKRISDLSLSELNWAVAKLEGLPVDDIFLAEDDNLLTDYGAGKFYYSGYDYVGSNDDRSNERLMGYDIINREGIMTRPYILHNGNFTDWVAEGVYPANNMMEMTGKSRLDAGLRCWVNYKTCGMVAIPHWLTD